MRLSLPLATILLTVGTSLASASPWNAPDSTRPAPWRARLLAPSVVIPWSMPAPIAPELPTPGYSAPWTQVEQFNAIHSEPVYPSSLYSDLWSSGDTSGSDSGDSGDGGDSGGGGCCGGDGGSTGCGGPDGGSGDGCGPSGDGF